MIEWEIIFKSHNNDGGCKTYRTKVIGGWLVQNWTYSSANKDGSRPISESMVFVSDQNHEWKVE